MQAEILKKDGKIIMMEAGADFADMLAKVLKSPLGAVSCVASSGPLANLQSSMSGLREPMFNGSKDEVLPAALDLAPMFHGRVHDPLIGNMEAIPCSSGGWTLRSTCDHGTWTSGAAFTEIKESSFEVSLVVPKTRSELPLHIMLGVAPLPLSHQLTVAHNYDGSGYYLFLKDTQLYAMDGEIFDSVGIPVPCHGDKISMKFSQGSPSCLSYSIRGGPWTASSFYLPDGVRYCPAVMTSQADMEMHLTIAEGTSTTGFNPVAKFLITNGLEISESSSLKMLHMLQKLNIDTTDLEIVSVTVTPEHLKRMLVRAFTGEKDVLQFAFGESEQRAAPEDSDSWFYQLSFEVQDDC
eukprot:TRINITY_DN74987_c0_g1_i1.p1 TRINITY_DN74987_c0_g1~~TRINITY_DN74987_c0_g1_i1.p1  ORF type:complete len:371 (-),score=47.04 TRINITY_DN74987_c0_g1_i1:16-1071(-)